ncbi:hypothetical protein BpHYR1_023500 [Brachionus plicatilis]|uniref:Uncharacterized protein n=1 Tax=Brachionus plicatilis TaxID=10195 RepID=A0A3M7Q611_BRAPC|nr:hypothetical protein BpHYR1_023500 [Brachionus plicatilis]
MDCNTIFCLEKFTPKPWKIASITMIPKKTSPTRDPNNYDPIIVLESNLNYAKSCTEDQKETNQVFNQEDLIRDLIVAKIQNYLVQILDNIDPGFSLDSFKYGSLKQSDLDLAITSIIFINSFHSKYC